MKGKVLSLVMAATLTAGLLAGCGGSGGETKAPETEKTTQAAAPSTEAAEDESKASEQTEAKAETKTEETQAQADGELEKVNVAFMPNYASLWAVATADAKGYYAEEGL